jgi:hypothetical protein
MGSDQLDEMREAARDQRLADELDITLDVFHALSPEIIHDDEHPYYIVLQFSEDSPKDLLKMVRGLDDGDFSLSLASDILEEHDEWDEATWTESGEVGQPYAVFFNSYCHLGDILTEYGEGGSGILRHSAPVITRMVFAQLIGALEAYLGDALLKRVMEDSDAVARLISQDRELVKNRFTLSDIAKNGNLVADTVRVYLQGILYHNLAKVAKIYKIALGIDIWPNKETKAALFVAIQRRHDCVHRDGRNKDGEELVEVTTEYVREILETVHGLVQHIETQLTNT